MTQSFYILLVEDNPGDAELIAELLAESPVYPYQIKAVSTLGEAREWLNDQTFDIVLLDLNLSDSRGLETLQDLKKAAPLMPVVVMTGLDDEETGIATVHEGAQDYLVKGQFDSITLRRVIRYAIERQQSVKKIQRLNDILSAIRQINQLIVREKDRQRLIEQGVRPMVDFGAWDTAWIVLFDGSGHPEAWAEAGIGEAFSRLIEDFKQGTRPTCARELFAAGSEGIFFSHDRHTVCRGCPLEPQVKGGTCMSCRLRNNGEQFGMITVSLKTQAAQENELELVKEAAGDIGLGLHGIRIEEQKNIAKEQLRQRENQLQRLMDNLPGMAYRCLNRPEWPMDFVSRGCMALTGYDPKELVEEGRLNYEALVHEDDRHRVWDQVKAALSENRPFELVYRIFDKNGNLKWVWEQGQMAGHNQNGEPLLEGLIIDITQRVTTEEQFQRMFYESTFPVMLHAEDGEVLAINKAWRDLTGYRHDEIPTIAHWTEKAYGKQKNEIKAHIDELYESNRRVDEGEFVIKTKDEAIKTWRFYTTPLGRLPDGRRIVMSQAEDITEQKNAEGYREHYIQELQLVSDTIIQASRLNDIDALCQLLGETIHWVNPDAYVMVSLYDRKQKAIKLKSMHGFGGLREAAKDYLGRDPKDFHFRPDEMGEEAALYTTGLLEQVPGGLYQLLAEKISMETCREVEALLDIGPVYTIGFALDDRPYGGVSLLFKKGENLGFRYAIETLVSHFSVIINRQQTEEERKLLESELRQAQKLEAIGTLAGGIAHDFNNILSSIIGYSELLLEDADKGSRFEQNLSQIYAAGARAKDLVKQILTFSRQTESEMVPLNVKLLVKESIKLLRASLPKSIDIKQALETDTLVSGDPAQIHQIIMNLCTNAAQAMENSGVMSIRLQKVDLDADFTASHPGMKPGKHVALRVSDTGPGIDPGIIGKIFVPFFTTKSEEQGTGLGLSVVHGIVEGHHGMIHVESQLGRGSEFIVYLPAAEFAATPTKKTEQELPKGSESILFVDDEHSIAQMVEQQLTNLGYAVEVRISSVDALELVRSEPGRFDLLITDMTMPQMTGVNLVKEIRRFRPDLPVILCTGFSEQINEEMAKEMGISTFLLKPIVRNEMAAAIRRALDT